MPNDPNPVSSDVNDIAAQVPSPAETSAEGFNIANPIHQSPQQRVDAIEMIGEETAAEFKSQDTSHVTDGMRYLHSSRTIHQLVTDRNRAVGLYIAVATLLWTASTALLNAPAKSNYIIPLEVIQKWCLPVTFGVLTVLAVLVAFLLIRTRVGLIFEAAKMNALLGLPAGRVKRVNPLSIFFIMQLIVSLAGGGSAAMLCVYLFRLGGMSIGIVAVPSAIIGIAISAALVGLYVGSVLHITSEEKLQGNVK